MLKIGGHTIDISSRDKLFFPEAGLTKGDLIDYYQQVAGVMVPHMKRYGVSMQRFPDGLQGEGFYTKDAPDYFPAWIKTIKIPKREGGSFDAPIVDKPAVLVYLADQAMITLHLYLARTDNLEHPDRMIYDLDPPEESKDYDDVRRAALGVKDVMTELDLKSWVQTTGSKGFHVVVPLDRSLAFDEVRRFARDVALVLVRRYEDRYTLEQRKNKRKGRIFLDTIRNSYGATAVAPYSVRTLADAPVATPLEWQEVEGGASPRDWTLKNLPNRLKQQPEPWSGLMRHPYSLSSRRKKLDRMLAQEQPAEEEKD
jgi:bifunctional non-homologous end joining protein LigD